MKSGLAGLFIIILFCGCSLAAQNYDGITSRSDILNVFGLPKNSAWPGSLPKNVQERLKEDKNSTSSLGKEVSRLLDTLESAPLPLVQRYPERYRWFKDLSSRGLDIRQAYNLADFLGEDYFYGYGSVAGNATLTFPEDNQPHLDYQTGWYFFAGNFKDKKGVPYGILCMFFRRALFPPFLAKQLGLNDIDNQAVEVQFAVTLGDKKINLQGHTAVIAGSSGLIAFNTDPFLARVGSNTFRSLQKGKLFPMKIHVKDPDIPLAVDLVLDESRPVLLQGDQGRAPAIYGLGSLYYSFPGIRTKGTITYKKEKKEVAGVMWMDNQWMAGIMPPGYARNIFIQALANVINGTTGRAREGWGWDWTEVQFNDGTAVTFSSIHSTSSKVLKNTGAVPPGRTTRQIAGGKYILPDGTASNVTGEVTLTHWTLSPYSKTWYPCGWEVSIPAVNLKYTMTPVVDNQLLRFANSSEYKEGAVIVKGMKDGRPVTGVGFGESVAYAGEDYYYKTKFKAMRVEDTPQHRDLLTARTPGLWLTVKSLLFLAALPLLLVIIAILVVLRLKR